MSQIMKGNQENDRNNHVLYVIEIIYFILYHYCVFHSQTKWLFHLQKSFRRENYIKRAEINLNKRKVE